MKKRRSFILLSSGEVRNVQGAGRYGQLGLVVGGTGGRIKIDAAAMSLRGMKIDPDKLAAFCRRHHICKLSVFGSILREDFGPESDVDFLVEFEPGKTPGLLDIARMEIELSEMIGRKADLRTAQDLSRHFREQVVKEAELQYAS